MVHASALLATDRDDSQTVSGKAVVSAGPGATIEAQTEMLEAQKLTIEVGGKPAIVMDAQGNVSILAANLTLDGSEIALKGSKLNKIQPGSAQAKATWIELELLDEEGKGVANAKYELHLADGTVKKGSLDGSGKARVENLPPGSCRVVFQDEEKKKR
jgi:type VI secretion system secreted protein VgrG